MRDFLLLDQTLPQRGKVVGRGPVLGAVLVPEVVLPGLERFHRHGAVAVVVVADAVEVVASHVHRKIPAPVVFHPLVFHVAAGLEGADLVRAAPEGGFQGRPGEVPLRPVVLRQHHQLSQDQRQLPVGAATEGESYGPFVELFDLLHVAVIPAVEGDGLGDQGLEGPDDVIRGHRLAVVPTRLRPQLEGDPRAVLGHGDALRQKAVFAEGLVRGPDHQRLVDAPDARRRTTLDDEGVEAVVGADGLQPHRAALGRLRIHVVEVLEVRRVLEVPVHGDAVAGAAFVA